MNYFYKLLLPQAWIITKNYQADKVNQGQFVLKYYHLSSVYFICSEFLDNYLQKIFKSFLLEN